MHRRWERGDGQVSKVWKVEGGCTGGDAGGGSIGFTPTELQSPGME